MNTNSNSAFRLFPLVLLAALLASCASSQRENQPVDSDVDVTRAEDAPTEPVPAGTGHIFVNTDQIVVGTIAISGMDADAAQIHLGPPGISGPPIVALEERSDNVFVVPDGTVLTDEQYVAYQMGDLYLNVHTSSPEGEVRAQLIPDLYVVPEQ
jgi:hypothetical protein